MKPLKVYISRNPEPVSYEGLWDVLHNNPGGILKSNLKFSGEGYVLIKQHFTLNGAKFCRISLVGYVNKRDYKFYPHEDTFPEGVKFYRDLRESFDYDFAPIMCMVEEDFRNNVRVIKKIAHYEKRGVVNEYFLATFSGKIPREIFIADGHHRFEAYDKDVLVSIMYSKDPALFILPTHRVLNLNISGIKKFMQGKDLVVSVLNSVEYINEVLKIYPLVFVIRDSRPIAVNTKGRHENILMEIPAYISDFYIFEGRYDIIHSYERSVEKVIYLARNNGTISVLLSPTLPEQVIRVARAGKRMPRKSTDFYPKLLAGVFYGKFHP